MSHRYFLLTIYAITLTIAYNLSWAAKLQPELVFEAYLEDLLSSRWEQAESHWLPEVVQKSKRLGITYTGINAKYDCASPLLNALDGIRQGVVHLDVAKVELYEGWARITIKLIAPGDSLSYPYYLTKSDDNWKLTSALQVFTAGWESGTTKYARAHYSNARLINEFALTDLDEFIEKLCSHLDIDKARIERLKEQKIDYYLCDEEEVKKLTGYVCHGLTNLQQDAIISRHLPHYHEIVHLMINFSLGELPLYIQPFIQEGLAVCFGGRWGRSPHVLFQMGEFLIEHSFCNPDDLLTYDHFHKKVGNPDISYPVSGLFVSYLIDGFGVRQFKALYRHLTGTETEVRQLTTEEVQSIVAATYGLPWFKIKAAFRNYAALFQGSGLKPGGTAPQHEPFIKLTSTHLSVYIWELEESYFLQIHSETNDPRGVILAKAVSTLTSDYRSRIFCEHLPDQKYRSEIYGIQFNQDEAGLYQYYTNNLLAKYVLSFWPCDQYWNAESKIIQFSFKKSLMVENLANYTLQLAEP
jgi:hypothetical protein